MSDSLPVALKSIRLVFELARADNPRLFDELSKFPQGSKRVNRLRVLAHDGLLVEHGVFSLGMPAPDARASASQGPMGQAHVTDELFKPGLIE